MGLRECVWTVLTRLARIHTVRAEEQELSGDLLTLDDTLPAAFERTAQAHRRRLAIGSGARPPTYHELHQTANRVAHALLKRGGAAGDRVAILMQHDTPLLTTILGVLKAGKIVVVLNPTDPPARLRELVHDAEPRLIVSDGAHRQLAAVIAGTHCASESYERCTLSGPTDNPAVRVSPDDVAFLCYTSGSTARPKAVMRTHRQEVRNARVHARAWALVTDDRIALLASLTGGLGTSLAWCALLHGATLYPFATMDKGFIGLTDALTAHRITIFASTASFFRTFTKALDDGTRFPSIRLVRLSSEPVTAEDFTAFQTYFSEAAHFVQTFGSSETGNIAHLHLRHADQVAAGPLPIGRPAEGIDVELLDEHGGPVAPGATGEIVVHGRALCAGYWRNPTATAAHFAETPPGSGWRVFYSGDLARLNPDGLLEFVGRKDTRVKIRGQRVELPEVEYALLRFPGIERAFVDTFKDPNDALQLVAYVVTRQPSSAAILRRGLRAVLPAPMVPTGFVFIEDFPLTPHGKIDRDKLRELHAAGRMRHALEQPTTDTELLLAGIWADVFDLPGISRHDDFFDLGGDSLAAATVASRVHAALGVTLNLGILHDHPTLAGLATRVEHLRRGPTVDAVPQLVRVSREHGLPLSFMQERVWQYSQSARAGQEYTSISRYQILGPLDREVLRACMSYMAARHELLRTSFPVVAGRPTQIVHPPEPVPLPFLDLTGRPDPERHAMLHMEQEAARGFDLAEGPLLRFSLLRLRPHEHWLLRTAHHIVHDAWSSALYFYELGLLYEAKRRGDEPPLPASEPLQYGDYAAWERQMLRRDGAAYHAAISWWADVLAGAPQVLELPFRRPQPRTDIDPAAGIIRWGIDADTAQRLAALARVERTTYYVVRLAACVMLLGAETGEPDVVLGTYVSNRHRAELQNMFGFFANVATLRFRYDPGMTFRDWLAVVRTRVVEMEVHCQIPYEELCRELRDRGVIPPDIQVIFNVARHNVSFHFGDIKLTKLDVRTEGMPWGFSMLFDEYQEDHACSVLFDAGIYYPAAVHGMVDRMKRLLAAVARHPDDCLDALLVMSAQDLPEQR